MRDLIFVRTTDKLQQPGSYYKKITVPDACGGYSSRILRYLKKTVTDEAVTVFCVRMAGVESTENAL